MMGDQQHRLLDQVDVISAVSGGSYTAAYYGLFGDRLFEDFRERFLLRNWQQTYGWMLANPVNVAKLASPDFNRSDLMARFLDEEVSDGKPSLISPWRHYRLSSSMPRISIIR